MEIEIQTESVEGLHSQGRVLTGVVGVFNPADELLVELLDAEDVAEIADKELVTDGAEKPFYLAF